MTTYENIAKDIYSKGFSITDHFLKNEHVSALRGQALELIENKGFRPARIGNDSSIATNPSIRRDTIHWLDEDPTNPSLTAWFSSLKTLAMALNRHLFLGLNELETHFSCYTPDSFYKKHVDQFQNRRERKISCVYYLNDNWQESYGGALQLYNQNDELLNKVLPIANRLICFQSNLPHEVCTNTKTRLSIAAWLKTRPSP